MNQDFQIRHESKHYRPCNQYKHHFHRSHHRSLLDGRSVKVNECSNDLTYSMVTRKRLLLSSVESAPSFYIVIHSSQTGDTVLKNTYLPSRELFFLLTIRYLIIMGSYVRFPVMFCTFAMSI